MTDLLSRDELVRYFRTEEYADEIADIISNFPPADHLPNLPQTIAEGFANSLFNQGKIEVNWAGMSDEEKLAYLTAARDLPDLPQEAPELTEGAKVYYRPQVEVTILRRSSSGEVYITSPDIGTFWTAAENLSPLSRPNLCLPQDGDQK